MAEKRSDHIATRTVRDACDRVSQSQCAKLRKLSKTWIWWVWSHCREDQTKASILALNVGWAYSMCLLVLLFASHKWRSSQKLPKQKLAFLGPRESKEICPPTEGILVEGTHCCTPRWQSPVCRCTLSLVKATVHLLAQCCDWFVLDWLDELYFMILGWARVAPTRQSIFFCISTYLNLQQTCLVHFWEGRALTH